MAFGPSAQESEASGVAVFAKPGRMRWTSEKPQPSVVVSDGKTLWLYDPSAREVQEYPVGEGFLSGTAVQFLLGEGRILEAFEVRAEGCGQAPVRLLLEPHEASSYERLELLVVPEIGDIRGTAVVDLFGNRTEVTFESQALGHARRPGEQPLSQVLFQFDAAAPARIAAGVSFRIEPVHADGHSWWDVEWAVTDHGAGRELTGHLCFPVARFEEWVMTALPRRWAVLLAGIAEEPGRPLSQLPLLDEAERVQVITGWNATAAEHPREATLHELVARQCARTPQAVALRTDAGQLTYGELEERVIEVAARLQAAGARPGDLIGLSLPPCVALVVGMLGILRAGAAFVPLDPAYPHGRLEFMLRDSGSRILLTARGVVEGLGGAGIARLEIDPTEISLRKRPRPGRRRATLFAPACAVPPQPSIVPSSPIEPRIIE